MSKSITQIPFPGSSGQTPTGAMQFQGDLPGLFIRGDTAIVMASKIRHLQQRLTGNQDVAVAMYAHFIQTTEDRRWRFAFRCRGSPQLTRSRCLAGRVAVFFC
jgi:hypothetical protein